MGWFISLFLVFFTLADFYFNKSTEHVIHTEEATVINQKAIEMVRYINAINDFLYEHPECLGSERILTDAQTGMKSVYNVRNVVYRGRVYVWANDSPGLLSALIKQTSSSALLGLVKNRRLIDTEGKDMLVAVPSVIKDGMVVYIN